MTTVLSEAQARGSDDQGIGMLPVSGCPEYPN